MTTDAAEAGQESGSALRQKLEESIETNKGLTQVLASKISKDFRYVKPEDLATVSFDQMEARAAELEAQRAEERATVLRESLAERGLEGDDLEAALAQLAGKGDEPKPNTAPASSRVASLGSLGGAPVTQDVNTDGAVGPDRIRAALRTKRK